ncbi:MAG: hypothetical protein KDA52_08515 [Planctomycetaceae bacterium]|nr:hypothetical protein [Planctomycetaceae bacterium]
MPIIRRTDRPLGQTCFVAIILSSLLALQGCQSKDSQNQADSTPDTPQVETAESDTTPAEVVETTPSVEESEETPVAEEPRVEPLLTDWDKPAAAILLTGETHGHLEPCGCSERQSGGLSRRADLAKQLRARGWPVTGFDLGGTVERTRRQSEMKFDVNRDALNTIGYKGLGLGPEDLKLGPEYLFTSFSNSQSRNDFDLPFVSANVTIFGTRDIGTPLSYRVIEVGDVKIGVTGVLGQTYLSEMFPGGENPDPSLIQIDEPTQVLPGVLSQLQDEKPDVMMLLAYAKPDESRALAEAFPEFDLVVTAGGPEDPVGDTEPVGDSLLLRVGTKGKNTAVVGFYPEASEGEKFRFKVIELDRFRFEHAPEIDERFQEYQNLLEAENLVANEPAIPHERGAEYIFVGSEKCAECHDEESAVWEDSHHHKYGFKSLTVEFAQTSDDPSLKDRVRFDRIHDPECICCHTAGWDPQEVLRYESGYVSADQSAHLQGVHCENCHGPASEHVTLEESGDASDAEIEAEREKMHITAEWAETNLCIKCHDHENSPDFEFDSYWKQIAH